MGDLKRARELMDAGEPDDAWLIVDEHLRNDPDDPSALILASFIHDKSRQYSRAYTFARRAVDVNPGSCGAQINLGKMAGDLYRLEEGERAFKRALELAKTDQQRVMVYINWSAILTGSGEYERAERVARKGLLVEDHPKLRGTLGMCRLSGGHFEDGWKLYDSVLGTEYRKQIQYGDEPSWDGTPGQFVVVHGEQGLGDEVSFASMIPDLIRVSRKVVIDCDARLQDLFARSFPQAKVYGTRWKDADWAAEDRKPDASIAMGGLGKFFRTNKDSFPGTAYLKSDPDKTLMWKALFKSKAKPVIGVGWTGGAWWTGSKWRQITLEQLLPVFRSIDAHWVSLQYRDASAQIAEFTAKYGVDLRQYSPALANNYDETSAMVAALDQVVCVQQSAVHLAGGLGIPVHCLVNKTTQWRYGMHGSQYPWFPNTTLYRQRRDDSYPVEDIRL